MKLRKGDQILVTSGKDKGKKGKIDELIPKKNQVVVRALNIYKKHRKAYGDQKGGIVELSRPLPTAKIALLCPVCEKPTRVNWTVAKNGEKTRTCAKCHRQIDKEGKVKKV